MSDRGISSRERRGPGPEPLRPAQRASCLLSAMRISMNPLGDEERGLQQAHHIYRFKVLQNGCVGALTMASSFGLFAAALGNIVRSRPACSVRLLGAPLPVLAGGLSALFEPAFDALLGSSATLPPSRPYDLSRDGLVYHAILPACFMMGNYAYMLSPLPKFGPVSRAGVVMSIAVSAAGSFVGRAGMELWAQDQHDVHGTSPADVHYVRPGMRELAQSRASTQVFMMSANVLTAVVFRGRDIPKHFAFAYPALMGLPYIARGALTPADPVR
jgi:hypothetical protein